jgi:O-acetylserine/cysteine efflux transporter
VHSWIAVKPTGAPTFTVYEGIGWRAYHGMSVLSVNGRSLDGRWFGAEPEIIVDLRGEGIDEAIKDIATAARDYPHADEYRVWPGPNSNTFTAFDRIERNTSSRERVTFSPVVHVRGGGGTLERQLSMKPLDTFWAVAVILIWGLNFVVGKIGLAQIPPLLLMTLRFSLVVILLFPFLKVQHGRMGQLAVVSVALGGLHYSLMFVGLSGIDAGPVSIAAQLMVPFSAVLAWAFFRERLTALQIAGMMIAFAGVYVLGGGAERAPQAPYLLSVVGAAFTLALATILIKRLGPISIFTLNAWIALFTVPQLLAATLILEGGQTAALRGADWRAWGAVAFMAIMVTILSHGLYYYLVRKYEVNQVVPLTLLTPVAAVVLAVLFLGEALSFEVVAGGVLVVAGVAMIQLRFEWLRRVPR